MRYKSSFGSKVDPNSFSCAQFGQSENFLTNTIASDDPESVSIEFSKTVFFELNPASRCTTKG